MDVFAGGSSQIKDVQETDRNSHNDARRNDQQAQTMRTSDGPATPLPSKFKQRGSLNEKVQPKPVNPYQALSYNVQSKSKKLPEHRQPSPPVPTPPSSGEQMPPPPIASQRLAGAKSKAPRRSTSSGSSKTAHSDSDKAAREPARTKSKSTEKPTRASSSNKQPQDSRRSKQDQQLKEQPQADLLPSPPPQKQQSNREQHAEKREGSKGSEEDEETQLILTEDPLPSSPAVGSYEGAGEEELIMSGDGTPSRERDEDSDESSASDEDDEEEEEDEVLLAGGTQTKRKREYDEFEEDGGYKRRDMGHRSQVSRPASTFERTLTSQHTTDPRSEFRRLPWTRFLHSRRREHDLRPRTRRPLLLDPGSAPAARVLARGAVSASYLPISRPFLATSSSDRPSRFRSRPLPRRQPLPPASAGSSARSARCHRCRE